MKTVFRRFEWRTMRRSLWGNSDVVASVWYGFIWLSTILPTKNQHHNTVSMVKVKISLRCFATRGTISLHLSSPKCVSLAISFESGISTPNTMVGFLTLTIGEEKKISGNLIYKNRLLLTGFFVAVHSARIFHELKLSEDLVCGEQNIERWPLNISI